jgi:phytoene/squalene synthetase
MAIPYRQALDHVKARVRSSRTSFHAGMAILPQARREAMYAFYAFCRDVDDIADESPTQDDSARGLQEWRERISLLFGKTEKSYPKRLMPAPAPSDDERAENDRCVTLSREGRDDIMAVLAPAIARFGLVEEDFQSVINGMAMDARIICAPSAKTLDLYCDHVASAVGRVSVRIFGDASAKAMDVSHHLGRAFQLTNILRDLSEDAARGRLYLPEELLTHHHVASRTPANVLRDAQLGGVCRDLATQAEYHFKSADAAMRDCSPSAMRPARIMRAYYGAIFERLIAEDWRDISVRIRLPPWQKIWLLLKHLPG